MFEGGFKPRSVVEFIVPLFIYAKSLFLARGLNKGWFARRHLSAQYALLCDSEANVRYELSTTGARFNIWQIRLYIRIFLSC